MAEPEPNQSSDPWQDGEQPAADTGGELIVDVSGFEGPLDLLLELARHHKIDLARISILALAEQYLAFIEKARKLQLELAADYLVMAAWLAYLKSRLLLPVPPDAEEALPDDMAARLAFRLQRLQAMRDAAARLMGRNLLGRDVYGRGAPEPLILDTRREYADNLIDLLKAYAERRQRKARHQSYVVSKLPTLSIKEARVALEKFIGTLNDWGSLESLLVEYLSEPGMRRSVKASSFAASLELVREGTVEIRQDEAFRPIYMRRRANAA